MNRRNGILASLTAICGMMSGRAVRAGDAMPTLSLPKGEVTLPLDSFTFYNFTLHGETVRLTPEEVMAALKVGG